MSIVPENSSFTFASGRKRRARKLRYVLLFALAAAAVYWAGHTALKRAESPPYYMAAATVVVETDAQPDGTPGLPRPDLRDVKRQLFTDANLREILGQLGAEIVPLRGESRDQTVQRALRQVRDDVQTTTDADSTPGEFRIALTYRSNNDKHTAAMVYGLAESYVRDVRRQYKNRKGRAHLKAKEAAARAEQEASSAGKKLDEFFELHFGKGPTPNFRQPEHSAAGRRPDPAERVAPSQPAPADNPEWVRLNDELTALRRQRSQLLVDRTPEHPEVEYIEIRIVDVQRQLVTVRQWINGKVIEQPTPSETPPTVPIEGQHVAEAPPDPQRHLEILREYRELQDEVDLAQEALQRANQRERLAWQQYQRVPPIQWEKGHTRRITSPPSPRHGLMLAALAAGLAMATGVGMASTGAALQPPLSKLEQVQAALPVPIVGTIPQGDPAVEPAPGKRWQPLRRITLITAGLLLVGGCVGALVKAWIGP